MEVLLLLFFILEYWCTEISLTVFVCHLGVNMEEFPSLHFFFFFFFAFCCTTFIFFFFKAINQLLFSFLCCSTE